MTDAQKIELLESQLADRDDMLNWIFRKCDVFRKRRGAALPSVTDVELAMVAEAAETASERREASREYLNR